MTVGPIDFAFSRAATFFRPHALVRVTTYDGQFTFTGLPADSPFPVVAEDFAGALAVADAWLLAERHTVRATVWRRVDDETYEALAIIAT